MYDAKQQMQETIKAQQPSAVEKDKLYSDGEEHVFRPRPRVVIFW